MEYHLNKKLDEKVKEFISNAIERSFRTTKVIIDEKIISVDFAEAVSEESFKKLMKELLFISKSINSDILFENNPERSYRENPQKFLEETKEVIKITEGMYLFQGIFLKIIKALNGHIFKIAEKYNAIEQEHPSIWPIDLFKKINYFKEFPQQVILCTTVKQDFQSKKQFSQEYSKDSNFQTIAVDQHLANSSFGLGPSVCDTCYYALQNTKDFQNTVFTTYNKAFRNEISKIASVDRLTIYSVRDIMYVGEEEFVLGMRQRIIDDLIDFLKKLDLICKIETANDPFFTNDSLLKNVFQNSARLKYEILAPLSFSNSPLAVGSINHHMDFFGKAFDIRTPKGFHVFSGCMGIGFERLAYVIYCQYGHNVELWPSPLRRFLGLNK